jgi:hypothetical protein
VAQKHGRETKRFRDAVQRIDYALGGRPGERLSQCLGLPINMDTLLERVKQLAQRSQAARIPALGVTSGPGAKAMAVMEPSWWIWNRE